MAGSLNEVTLIGNCGKDPEIRSLNSGGKVATLSLATSETWRDRQSGEKKEKTDWHQVVVFGPSTGDGDGLVGVIEQYVQKGSKIMVRGKLQTRKWQDQSGQDRYTTEVVLNGFDGKLILLGDASGGRGGRRPPPPDEDSYGRPATTGGMAPPRSTQDDLDDSIPF